MWSCPSLTHDCPGFSLTLWDGLASLLELCEFFLRDEFLQQLQAFISPSMWCLGKLPLLWGSLSRSSDRRLRDTRITEYLPFCQACYSVTDSQCHWVRQARDPCIDSNLDQTKLSCIWLHSERIKLEKKWLLGWSLQGMRSPGCGRAVSWLCAGGLTICIHEAKMRL